jgi:hypothetical protein
MKTVACIVPGLLSPQFFDIHVRYIPVVSLLVTGFCTLNLALVFFTLTRTSFFFVSHTSLHLHTVVINFHDINLRLVTQLVCPLLESTALLFYFTLPYLNFGSLYFLSFIFQLNLIRLFQVHFFLLIRFSPFMSSFAFCKLFITLSSFLSNLCFIWQYS